MKLKNKLQRFMYGRYGIDDLYRFLFKVYIVLLIIGLFINSRILLYIEFALIIFMLYRVFSKNIYHRQKENRMFLKFKKKIMKPFDNWKRNIKDRNYYVYKKCRHCKTTLKLPLPSERGIKHAKCPECKRRVTMLILRKQKVEIIRDNKTKKRFLRRDKHVRN